MGRLWYWKSELTCGLTCPSRRGFLIQLPRTCIKIFRRIGHDPNHRRRKNPAIQYTHPADHQTRRHRYRVRDRQNLPTRSTRRLAGDPIRDHSRRLVDLP